MEPNYNFDNELPEKYGVKNYEFRTMANELRNKYKFISDKEYKVMIWIGCNMATSSPLRVIVFNEMKKNQLLLRNKELINKQLKINL